MNFIDSAALDSLLDAVIDPTPVSKKADADITTYGMKCIPFTRKMIRRLLRGANAAIIDNERDKNYSEHTLPKKGELYYIAEPFKRKYGWKNNMYILRSITYLADDFESIVDTGFDEIDPTSTTFSANAMLEHEARFFIKINRCRYRALKSLKLSETIHDNLYENRQNSYVLVIDFEMVTPEYVKTYFEQKAYDQFVEDYF